MSPIASARSGRTSPFALLVVILALFLAVSLSGCDKLMARDQLNKGVAAYKNGQFDSAIQNFQKAKELDPGLINARLYLATAYASQFIPGAPSEENKNKGTKALAEYQEVLKMDAQNLTAIDGIASMLYNMAGGPPPDPSKFEESKKYHLRHIELKPTDPDPYYSIGVIDWTLSFRINGEMRAEYNRANPKKPLREDDPFPAKLREEYTQKCGALVEDGIAKLQKAIQLRPDYDDAMAYLNLLYRRKADQVQSMDERAQLLKDADALVDRVKEIKQKRAEAPQKS